MLNLKNNNKNPDLIFDLNNGVIKISGRSTMFHPQEFYPSVINLIEEYVKNPNVETTLEIDLEYYNSLTKRFLLRIVELISRIELKRNHVVTINWHFDPDDEDIAYDIKLFSNIIEYRINAIANELA